MNKTASFLLELGDLQCKVDLSGGWTEEMGPPLSQSCTGSTSQIGQSSGHRKSDKGRGSNWKMKRVILKWASAAYNTYTPFVSKTVSSQVGLVLDYFSIVQKHHQVTGIIWINALSSHHGNLDPPRHHKADRNYVKTASRLLSVQITPGAVVLDVFSEKRTKWCWNVINDNSSDCWGEQKDAKLTL